MKRISLLKQLKLRKSPSAFSSSLARTKNDWESIKSYPYNPVDEHEEPKSEEIIKDIYDSNYYKFGFKAQSDNHGKDDMFIKYREFQHLYLHPKEPFIGWTHGSVVAKYFYIFLPFMIFFYFCYIQPIKNQENLGRKYPHKPNTGF